jgi:hypothetical protein
VEGGLQVWDVEGGVLRHGKGSPARIETTP